MPKQSLHHKKIWNNYITLFKAKLNNYIPKIHLDTNYTAVIVEPRNHADLEVVIQNVMYFLNESDSNIKWGLTIFHGTDNQTFVEDITQKWDNVNLINLNVSNLGDNSYNDLLKTPTFWKKISTENLLIFQTDSLLLRFGIDEFLKWDYVGAPWIRYREGSIVGNGGLSFRKKSKMVEISSHYYDNSIEMEDIFFCKYLNREDVADYDSAKIFSVEDVYYKNPIGVHQPKIEYDKLESILKNGLNNIKL